jgi:ATP-binding cassette subfamily C exporter for protease/lipase
MVTMDQFAAPSGAAVSDLWKVPSGEILASLKKYSGGLIAVGLFSGLINLLYLVPAIYMLQIYDRVLISQSENTLIALTVLVIGLFVVTGLLEGVRSSAMSRIGDALGEDLSSRIYTAMFNQQLSTANGFGNQPIWDLNRLQQFFSSGGLNAFLDLPWLPIFIITTFLLHPVLGGFLTLGAVALFFTAWISERITRTPLAQANELATAASGLVTSHLRNAEVVHALGMLPQLSKRWSLLQVRARDLQQHAMSRIRIAGGFTRILRMVLQSGTLGLGAWLAIQGDVTPGVMIAAAILATRALSPLESVISQWKSFLSTMLSTERLTHLLATNPNVVKGMDIPRPAGRVVVENIFVSPPNNKQFVLKGLSFKLVPGEVLGVLGPSAAGKSTLARVLTGVWPAQIGRVQIDGSDIKNLDRSVIGPAMGYLPQDIELFSGTVGENISRFGPLESSMVIDAANACGIHGALLGLTQGYDTPIGDAGIALSAGQRQLLGLARAIYGKPSLIVLDEPSSNLDESGQHNLQLAIKAMKSWGSAVVVISHQLSVLRQTDRLLMMKEGQILKLGKTDELLSSPILIKKKDTHASHH